MIVLWIWLGCLGILVLFALLGSAWAFRMAFLVTKKQRQSVGAYDIPVGEIYEPYREKMVGWIKEARAMPHKEITVTSFDGLALRGRYFEYAPGAPVELMFHGYRGTADRDLSGGVQRCFRLGHSALIVDQRASGKSEGNVITFGILESRDCHTWVQWMTENLGPDVKIILTGISMGAATVLTAAGSPLPENVIGVLADCGYDSPRNIIRKVIADMHLPVGIGYFLAKLGARLYGGFDLEQTSPLEAMKKCTVPVIFFHGDADDFVPCDMSRRNYEACTAAKKLVIVPGAGHGLAYPFDPSGYLNAVKEFFHNA